MKRETLIRWTAIIAFMNIVTTTYFLVGRPDLMVRASADKVFAAAVELEKQGAYQEAAELYEDVFYDMSVALIAPLAGKRLADIYRRRLGEVEKARDVLREAAAFKGSAYAKEAQTDLDFIEKYWDGDGETLKIWYDASNESRKGNNARAMELIGKIVSERTTASLRPVAMLRLGKMLKAAKRTGEAKKVLTEFMAAYPKDSGFKEAQSLIGSL